MVVSGFNAVRADARYIAAFDLNGDNTINMAGVMLIVTKFNTIVSSPSGTVAIRNSSSEVFISWRILGLEYGANAKYTNVLYALEVITSSIAFTCFFVNVDIKNPPWL